MVRTLNHYVMIADSVARIADHSGMHSLPMQNTEARLSKAMADDRIDNRDLCSLCSLDLNYQLHTMNEALCKASDAVRRPRRPAQLP